MAESKVVALPSTSDRNAWSDDEAAVVEAAGLVFTYGYGQNAGTKVLAPRPVVSQFLHLAERTGLDPLARQLYCIGRAGRDGIEWSIQTGIDGFRLIAERSKLYAGQDAPQWLTADGEWVDVFVKALHGEHPLAARVRVYRHDWDKPAVGIATWDEYVQTKSNGEVTAMWKQRGPGQLAKCAEALALRKAFPQDLSGLYTSDEIGGGVLEVREADQGENVPSRAKSRVAQLASSAPAQDASEESDAPVDAELVDDAGDGRTGVERGDADPVGDWPVAPIPADGEVQS